MLLVPRALLRAFLVAPALRPHTLTENTLVASRRSSLRSVTPNQSASRCSDVLTVAGAD